MFQMLFLLLLFVFCVFFFFFGGGGDILDDKTITYSNWRQDAQEIEIVQRKVCAPSTKRGDKQRVPDFHPSILSHVPFLLKGFTFFSALRT